MSTILKNSEMDRWFALFILLLILVLVYFLFFQGFVDDHMLLNEEMSDQEQSRQEYTELADMIPDLQQRIIKVKETVGDNSNFLTADSYNLGTAELTRILKGIVTNVTQVRSECDIVSNTPSKDRNPDKFEKIILKVRMRCQFEKMATVLMNIENNIPYLFIDNLQLEQRIIRRSRKNVSPKAPILEIRFDLSAYMNKPIRVKDNDKK
jgi:general secretion pathway protein M